MRIETRKTYFVSFFWLAMSLLLASCTREANSPLGTGVNSLLDEEVSPIYKNEPFAYDAVLDTISYNSCYGSNLKDSGVYGFSASASENPAEGDSPKSGVRISKTYLDFVGTKINPSYPSTTLTKEQIQSYMAKSPLNGSAVPLISIRRPQTLDVLPQDLTSTNLSSRLDYFSVLGTLTGIRYITSLLSGIIFTTENKVLSQGPRINDFIYTDDNTRTLRADLGYNLNTSEEFYSVQLRKEFNRDNLALALTFHDANNATDFAVNPLSPDSTNLKRAYGKAYYFKFTTISTPSHNSIPANLLNSISERDLDTSSVVVGATWSCRQYMVVRAEDRYSAQATGPVAGGPLALPITYDDLNNTHLFYPGPTGALMTGWEIIQEIRRQYSAAEWDIARLNLNSNGAGTDPVSELLFVVIPKRSICYDEAKNPPASGADPGVDYTPWDNTDDAYTDQTPGVPQGCFQASFASQGIFYSTAEVPRKRCANWVSVCTRTSATY